MQLTFKKYLILDIKQYKILKISNLRIFYKKKKKKNKI